MEDILNKVLLDSQDMIKLLNCSKSTFYGYIKRNEIPEELQLKLGNVLKFKTAKVKEWLGL